MDSCDRCDGTGWIMTCIDDICVGSGECMHRDGEAVCPQCHGEGEMEIDDYYAEPHARELEKAADEAEQRRINKSSHGFCGVKVS